MALVQDRLAPTRGVTWRTVAGMCEMNILGSEVLCCIFATLVQDGPSRMRNVTWRAVAVKLKTGMCAMNILGFKVLCCIFGALVQDGFSVFS